MRGDSKATFSPGNYGTTTTPEAEWRVVNDPEEGKRVSLDSVDKLHKRRVRALVELREDKEVKDAGLRDEEILALLLYTGWKLTGSFAIPALRCRWEDLDGT